MPEEISHYRRRYINASLPDVVVLCSSMPSSTSLHGFIFENQAPPTIEGFIRRNRARSGIIALSYSSLVALTPIPSLEFSQKQSPKTFYSFFSLLLFYKLSQSLSCRFIYLFLIGLALFTLVSLSRKGNMKLLFCFTLTFLFLLLYMFWKGFLIKQLCRILHLLKGEFCSHERIQIKEETVVCSRNPTNHRTFCPSKLRRVHLWLNSEIDRSQDYVKHRVPANLNVAFEHAQRYEIHDDEKQLERGDSSITDLIHAINHLFTNSHQHQRYSNYRIGGRDYDQNRKKK